MPLKNLHLASSALIITIVGLAYGFAPERYFQAIFDFNFQGADLHNLLKAIMGLYLGMAMYWLSGIYMPDNWRPATQTCVLVMGGLAAGRIISLLTDGVPSVAYVLGLLVEVGLMWWGIFNLRREDLGK